MILSTFGISCWSGSLWGMVKTCWISSDGLLGGTAILLRHERPRWDCGHREHEHDGIPIPPMPQ